MTQQEVADSLGVSNKTVSGWETGASCPDISMLPAIAELFGVTCDELLRGERIPPSEPQVRTEEKREKALARMLAHYKNTAAISAWLSAGLYLLAAVAALLIGCAVLESLVGFFAGLIFVMAGAFHCLIHGKYLRSQISQDDFESAAAEDCLRALSSRQTAVLILAAAAFGFILPHVFVPVHFGLRIGPALGYGALGAVLCGGFAWGMYAIVRAAKKSYRACREKFFWTLKNGVVPYASLSVLAVVLFFVTAYSVSLRVPDGMAGHPWESDSTYGQMAEALQENDLFERYENTLQSTHAVQTTATQEVLDGEIGGEGTLCQSWTCVFAADEGAVYYFPDFPQEYAEAYDVAAKETGAFVRVPVLTLELENGMVISLPVLNPEYQGGVRDLDQNAVWAEDTALFHDITLTFDRPPYEIAEAKRRMTSAAIQIGVTAGAWLLVVAVYTAIYIPRRKKFLRNLEKKGGR